MLTQFSLAFSEAIDVDAALRLTLSILLGQLFVKIHLASLELLNPLQPVRRESSFLEVVQDDDQQAGRDECDDDPTSAQCGPLRGGPGRPSSAVRAAPLVKDGSALEFPTVTVPHRRVGLPAFG